MPTPNLRPVKVVLPRPVDFRPPPTGGSTKQFGEVTDTLRQKFQKELEDLANYYSKVFDLSKDLPAVAKVVIKPEAVAKSHRPTEIFNKDTCPIIGANRMGELFVSIRRDGLERAASILSKKTKKVEAHISTLQVIEPYTATDALGISKETSPVDYIKRLPAAPLRLRLFHHPEEKLNRAIEAELERFLAQNGLPKAEKLEYAPNLDVFKLQNLSPDLNTPAIAQLADFAGIKSIVLFPNYNVVRTNSVIIGNLKSEDFPNPDPARSYGLVGIIDTGTDPDNSLLQAWVVERDVYVPEVLQDNSHGSFVGALIAQGRWLNHDDPRFPMASCKIVDVVALDTDGISEDALLAVIDASLKKHPDVKVWNLSLAFSEPCVNTEFSMIAAALDQRAKQYGVLFVIAAGNYSEPPFRSWPPKDLCLGEADRICPPADAVYALTVGSIAHRDTSSSCVRDGQPSPFSRRGPGPAYLMKPEIVFPGGNCNPKGLCAQTGVISVDGKGHKAEDIGTSFATPLASATVGDLMHELNVGDDSASPALIKALTIHSAFLESGPPLPLLVDYYGAGMPRDTPKIVSCTEQEATIIFQVKATNNLDFIKRNFPMPSCLSKGGRLKGEIFMTLLYEPALDRDFGIEYCRTNVSASFGTEVIDTKTGKRKYTRQVHPVPDLGAAGSEAALVKHNQKWSPVKLYHRIFTSGPAGADWRLNFDVVHRSGFATEEEQDVVLLFTIRAHYSDSNVYEELVHEMNKLDWGATDLQVRSRQRLQN